MVYTRALIVLGLAGAFAATACGGSQAPLRREGTTPMVVSSGTTLWLLGADRRLGRIVLDPAMPAIESSSAGVVPDVEPVVGDARVRELVTSGIDEIYAAERLLCMRRGERLLCAVEQGHIEGAPLLTTTAFDDVRSVRRSDLGVCVEHATGEECVSAYEPTSRCETRPHWSSGAYACSRAGADELACEPAPGCPQIRVPAWTERDELVVAPSDFCTIDPRSSVARCYVWMAPPNAPLVRRCEEEGCLGRQCFWATDVCDRQLVVTRDFAGASSIAATNDTICVVDHAAAACWSWSDARAGSTRPAAERTRADRNESEPAPTEARLRGFASDPAQLAPRVDRATARSRRACARPALFASPSPRLPVIPCSSGDYALSA